MEGGEGSAKYIETQRTETEKIDKSSREIPAKDEPTEAEIVGPYEDIGPELQPIGGKVEDSLPHVPAGGRVGLNEKIKDFEYLLFHVDPIVIPPKTQTTILLPAPRKLLDFQGPVLVEPAPDRESSSEWGSEWLRSTPAPALST